MPSPDAEFSESLYQNELKKTRWDRVNLMLERIKQHPWYQKPDENSQFGYYAGRPIIGPYSKINGGVFLGAYPREAIVVEDTRPFSPLPALYEKVKSSVANSNLNFLMIDFFQNAFSEVRERLKGDDEALEKILLERGWINDQKVHLDNFFILGLGVCRHQAAAIAYLTERAIEDGLIPPGKVTIDRITSKSGVGHDWVRYETDEPSITPYIIDVSQGYVGWLDGLDKDDRWLHAREGEEGFSGF